MQQCDLIERAQYCGPCLFYYLSRYLLLLVVLHGMTNFLAADAEKITQIIK